MPAKASRTQPVTVPGEVPEAFRKGTSGTSLRLLESLGRILGQLDATLAALPARIADGGQRACARCLTVSYAWRDAHETDLDAARQTAIDAGVPDDPELDLTPYLPPELRPGAPDGPRQVQAAATTVAGWDLCPGHAMEQAAREDDRYQAQHAALMAATEADQAAARLPGQRKPALVAASGSLPAAART